MAAMGAADLGGAQCGLTIRLIDWEFRTPMDLFRRDIGAGNSGDGLTPGDPVLRIQGGRVQMDGIGPGSVDLSRAHTGRVLRLMAVGLGRTIGDPE